MDDDTEVYENGHVSVGFIDDSPENRICIIFLFVSNSKFLEEWMTKFIKRQQSHVMYAMLCDIKRSIE